MPLPLCLLLSLPQVSLSLHSLPSLAPRKLSKWEESLWFLPNPAGGLSPVHFYLERDE